MLVRRNPWQMVPYNRRYVNSWRAAGAALAGGASYLYGKFGPSYAKSLPAKYNARKGPKLTARQKKAIKKRGGIIPKAKPSLKKEVKDLKKVVDRSNGTLIYRKRGTGTARSSVNSTSYFTSEDMTMANLELVLAQLRFFNPSVPGTLTQGSGASGTYYREYLFKTIHTNCVIRNNYQIPAKVTAYLCVPREDTSIAPTTAFSNGLADVGNPTNTSSLVYLTDSDEFNDLWKIQKSQSRILQPGQQMSMLHDVKNILYSPATYDSHALSYQKRFGSYVLVCKVEGILGHDSSVSTEQGMAQAGIDVMWETVYKVVYDAGIDLKFIYLDDTADTFTNGALVSSMPVADNIGYSVS